MMHFHYYHSYKIASNDDLKTSKRVSVLCIVQSNIWQRSQPNVGAADKDPGLGLKALYSNYLVMLFSWTWIDTML